MSKIGVPSVMSVTGTANDAVSNYSPPYWLLILGMAVVGAIMLYLVYENTTYLDFDG